MYLNIKSNIGFEFEYEFVFEFGYNTLKFRLQYFKFDAYCTRCLK